MVVIKTNMRKTGVLHLFMRYSKLYLLLRLFNPTVKLEVKIFHYFNIRIKESINISVFGIYQSYHKVRRNNFYLPCRRNVKEN